MRINSWEALPAPMSQALGPLRAFTEWLKARHCEGNSGIGSLDGEVAAGSRSYEAGLDGCA